MSDPIYSAIHFLDGWTGTAYYVGQLILCGPRTTEDHKRHATEAEAIACIKGEFIPGSPLSVAQRNRRTAEAPPLAPATASGSPTRPVDVPDRLARQSVLRGTPAPVVPARRSHPAACKHKWCYCYDAEHIKMGGPCRRCQIDGFNKEKKD